MKPARAAFAALAALFAAPRVRADALAPVAITDQRQSEAEAVVSPRTEKRVLDLFGAFRALTLIGRRR